MFNVPSNFWGTFKTGDNVALAADSLVEMYERRRQSEHPSRLNKPIVITLGSMIEAILFDYFEIRVATHTREGIQNVAAKVLNALRGKEFDQLCVYIDQLRKHDLLPSARTENVYDALHEIRKLRNRIHIQNKKWT